MSELIPKKNKFLFALALATFGLLVYLAGLFIVQGKIGEIETLYKDTESDVFKEERVRVLTKEALEHADDIELVRSFFVKPGDELHFIETIEELGKETGVSFDLGSIGGEKVEQSNPTKEDLNIRIEVEGSWANIVSFSHGLERLSFGSEIKSMELNADGSRWSGFINLVVFKEK